MCMLFSSMENKLSVKSSYDVSRIYYEYLNLSLFTSFFWFRFIKLLDPQKNIVKEKK